MPFSFRENTMTELEYQERKVEDLHKMASAVMDEKYSIMSWGFDESNVEKVNQLGAIYSYLSRQAYNASIQVEWLKSQK